MAQELSYSNSSMGGRLQALSNGSIEIDYTDYVQSVGVPIQGFYIQKKLTEGEKISIDGTTYTYEEIKEALKRFYKFDL